MKPIINSDEYWDQILLFTDNLNIDGLREFTQESQIIEAMEKFLNKIPAPYFNESFFSGRDDYFISRAILFEYETIYLFGNDFQRKSYEKKYSLKMLSRDRFYVEGINKFYDGDLFKSKKMFEFAMEKKPYSNRHLLKCLFHLCLIEKVQKISINMENFSKALHIAKNMGSQSWLLRLNALINSVEETQTNISGDNLHHIRVLGDMLVEEFYHLIEICQFSKARAVYKKIVEIEKTEKLPQKFFTSSVLKMVLDTFSGKASWSECILKIEDPVIRHEYLRSVSKLMSYDEMFVKFFEEETMMTYYFSKEKSINFVGDVRILFNGKEIILNQEMVKLLKIFIENGHDQSVDRLVDKLYPGDIIDDLEKKQKLYNLVSKVNRSIGCNILTNIRGYYVLNLNESARDIKIVS